MKTISIRAIFLPILILISGCATTNMDRAEKTTASMEVVEKNINQISVQLSATEAALENLLTANQSELGEAFEVYKENVDKVIRLRQQLRTNTNRMRANGNEYFTEWEIEGETYQNPELRQVSTQRREELSNTFDQISEKSGEISRDLQAYISDVEEIESYLANDLTPKGINGVKPLSQKVKNKSRQIKTDINQMQNSIATTKPEMKKLARN